MTGVIEDAFAARQREMAAVAAQRAVTFSEALLHLKAGGRVARAGWNGKGMHLALVSDWNGQINADFDGDFKLLPWIGMKTAQGDFVPWLASQTDILADDWAVTAG